MLGQEGSDFKTNNRHLHEMMNLRETIVKLVEASEMIRIFYNDGHFCSSEDSQGYYDFLEKASQMVNCLQRSVENKLNKLSANFRRGCIKKDK